MNAKSISLLLAFSCFIANANALTIIFHQDTADVLDFEMSNLGPTPGDQSILSPSGTWGIATFVHQFNPVDEFAEIGAFIKKILPVEEAIGTDVILPQIYGLSDFPFLQSATGEFGDEYTGTFELLPGSGDNAQQWNWVMTLKTATASNEPTTVSDSVSNLPLLAFGLLGLVILTVPARLIKS